MVWARDGENRWSTFLEYLRQYWYPGEECVFVQSLGICNNTTEATGERASETVRCILSALAQSNRNPRFCSAYRVPGTALSHLRILIQILIPPL